MSRARSFVWRQIQWISQFRQRKKISWLLQEYRAENIFYINEIGLLCKWLPKRTHVLNKKSASVKISEERVTVLVNAKMVGEKLLLMEIGKKPILYASKGLKNLQFPVILTPKQR